MKYVWPNDGKCSIAYLRKGRFCSKCGEKGRFLINVGKKKYTHLMCY